MVTRYILSDATLDIVANGDGTISIIDTDDSNLDLSGKIPYNQVISAVRTDGVAAVALTGFILTPPASPAANTLYECMLTAYDTVKRVWVNVPLQVYSPATALTQTQISDALRSQINGSILGDWGWTVGGTTTVTISTTTTYPVLKGTNQNGITVTAGSGGTLKTVNPAYETTEVTATNGILYDRGEINYFSNPSEAAGAAEQGLVKLVVFANHAHSTFRTDFENVMNAAASGNYPKLISTTYKS